MCRESAVPISRNVEGFLIFSPISRIASGWSMWMRTYVQDDIVVAMISLSCQLLWCSCGTRPRVVHLQRRYN